MTTPSANGTNPKAEDMQVIEREDGYFVGPVSILIPLGWISHLMVVRRELKAAGKTSDLLAALSEVFRRSMAPDTAPATSVAPAASAAPQAAHARRWRYPPWSPEEETALRDAYSEHEKTGEGLSALFRRFLPRRTSAAASIRANHLGIFCKNKKHACSQSRKNAIAGKGTARAKP